MRSTYTYKDRQKKKRPNEFFLRNVEKQNNNAPPSVIRLGSFVNSRSALTLKEMRSLRARTTHTSATAQNKTPNESREFGKFVNVSAFVLSDRSWVRGREREMPLYHNLSVTSSRARRVSRVDKSTIGSRRKIFRRSECVFVHVCMCMWCGLCDDIMFYVQVCARSARF